MEEGFSALAARSLKEARSHLCSGTPDVLLLDVRLPDGSGLELLDALEDRRRTEVLILTAHGTPEVSLEAQHGGASHYFTKPLDLARFRHVLSQVARTHELKKEANVFPNKLSALGLFGPMVGSSPCMQQVYEQVIRSASTDINVLITGETGVGKELVAATLHQFSMRHEGPYLETNCGAIPHHLIESEFFGHEPGSFTGASQLHRGCFERANGGTLLLDEITEMPIELQVKLLRVLETRKFVRVGGDREIEADFRVVATSNRVPEAAIVGGRLRQDLFYRLKGLRIHVPPLRMRGDDLDLLAGHFLAELNRSEGTSKKLGRSALDQMRRYSWPGNVRELKNVVHQAYIFADDEITVKHLPMEVAADVAFRAEAESALSELGIIAGMPLAEAEKRLILGTLKLHGNNRKEAAKALVISLRTLYNHLKSYKHLRRPLPVISPGVP